MIYRRQWTQPSGCGTVGDSRLFLNYFFPFYLPLGVLLFLFCARIFKLSPLKLGFPQEGAGSSTRECLDSGSGPPFPIHALPFGG